MNNYYLSDGWVKAVQGPAIPGAQIYVCLQPANVTPPITPPRTLPVPWVGPNPQALIYSDAGVTPIVQPIITDGFGHYDFYALPGLYTVVVMFGGKVQQFYIDQTLGNAGSSNPSPLVLSTNGTPNFNQTALNFVQGSGITLSTDNFGNMTITGSGITYPGDATKFLNGTGVFSTPPFPPAMTSTVGGLVPTPPNDATKFLNGAGAFSVPSAYTPPSFSTAGNGGFWSAGFPLIPAIAIANQNAAVCESNNQLWIWQFENLITRTIRKVTVYSADTANGTANFGIYTASGSLVLDSGSFTNYDPPGFQSNAITPVVLPPGIYYFAQSSTNISASYQGMSAGVPGTLAYTMLNLNAVRCGHATNALSAGLLTGTLGALTAVDPGSTVIMTAVLFEP